MDHAINAVIVSICCVVTNAIDHDMRLQTGRVRIRQHVNPLKRELQTPAEPPVWHNVFADPSLPLCIDIGSGGGRFLLALSRQWPRHNFLGLEIRRPVRSPTIFRDWHLQ